MFNTGNPPELKNTSRFVDDYRGRKLRAGQQFLGGADALASLNAFSADP